MRFCSDSTHENLQSSENIGKPMHYAIAESENMDSPCNDIIVFIFFHIFPSELMPISEYKIMNMEFGSSSENIGFSTKLLSPAHGNNLHFDCVDVVVLEVGEIDNNFFETVIGPSIKYNSLIGWFISNVADIDCAEFKKFWMRAFGALQELFLLSWALGDLQDSIQASFVSLGGDGSFTGLHINFLCICMVLMPDLITKFINNLLKSLRGELALSVNLKTVGGKEQSKDE